ncbi:mediator complex subunit MED14-domain-containing protein [Suillus subalutaceus]|uniref:mediator complex subunit MED14-domain-containing protein n=1 Tax=Suillus subalutaceus TaxID=48586 RepID=UPI001B87EA19|nr:mediator complex subunit MED14-domain-containing protein [Suillus subalutaceus]KAG1871755.1 mediator complex subunit MED14-domain-containing protein [Suillus subalutaceus]
MEELENELPRVLDGQVPLGDLLSRVAQAIYAELSELAETLPNMSDGARKRTLADWVVKTKKQVVKLYAITKWARDADTVQKCMNITAFLMNQNQQFEDVMRGLTYAKESLDPSRLRNHDLLTSLDKSIIPITPLTDAEVISTLSDMEDAIRYRLRMSEIIPVEMFQHRIANGRVHFSVPKLFETAIYLGGAEKNDSWFFDSVKFLITVGGDLTGMQEFPSEPTGLLRRHIADEADRRMSCYLPLPDKQEFAPNPEDPPRPQLPEGTVDAPLSFFSLDGNSRRRTEMMSMLRGCAPLVGPDFLKVEMRDGRKTLAVSYWMRPPQPGAPVVAPNRLKLPPHGGTLTISIVEKVDKKAARSPIARMLAELQRKSKLGDMRPSDDVESLQFDAKWEPMKGVLAANIDAEEAIVAVNELAVESDNIDFESMLRKVIEVHTQAILRFYLVQLQRGLIRVFSPAGKVVLVSERGYHSLRVHLCADEVAIVSIDTRTGRLSIRDTGDLAAAGRGPRFSALSDKLNEAPNLLFDTITDIVEQKANYLGFQVFPTSKLPKEEIQKLGSAARGMMYIQLANFPTHYLVLVLTDEEFRYALISTKMLSDTMFGNMIMEDIGWLDVRRIRGDRSVGVGMDEVVISSMSHEPLVLQKRKRDDIPSELSRSEDSFNLETQVLRELYAYCCARVAYTRVERQFKLRGIPYTHVNPTVTLPQISELGHIQSSLARSVPALCVQSSDILSGAPAAEAAMPNIRVIPLNWWSDKKAQVVTCVKLKYVQQPVGKRAAAGIIYDAAEAVVSFLSEEVDTCVDEFLEEWARVSKMVVIAREVARMAKGKKWPDVRLLSFDLQTVEFAYASDYTVLITCTDQLSPTGGSFELRFSRCAPSPTLLQPSSLAPPHLRFSNHQLRTNPHEEAEPYLCHVLRHGPLASSLDRLVELLRNTLPIAVELEHMRASSRDTKQSPGRGRGRPRIAATTGTSEPWVDTYVKGLGWWRVLYGDLRHALDFRLMTEQRIAILDASYSLFGSSSSISSPSPELFTLLPIPDFKTLVIDAIKSVRIKDEHARVAYIDAGVVCDSSFVSGVARALHERVLKKLRDRQL